MSTKFRLTQEQIEKIEIWEQEQNLLAVEKQKKNTDNPNEFQIMNWEAGYPYDGTVGVGLTYMFTPTSIGTIIKVKHNHTKNELDLTDYDNF